MSHSHFEKISYLLFGICTTIVNISVFNLFLYTGLDYKIANLFALILGKTFAFVVNKKFVFKSHTSNIKDLFSEFIRFFSGRIFTGLVDYFGLILLVEFLSCSEKSSKYSIQVIVIVLNYILTKASFKNNR